MNKTRTKFRSLIPAPTDHQRSQSEHRIFLRRHYAAFSVMAQRSDARKATIRACLDAGIPQATIAEGLKVDRKTVWSVANRGRAALTELEQARSMADRARKALRVAEGRERAALERLQAYGVAA